MSTVKLETRSLAEAVADRLRMNIFSGVYTPGESLVESRIAADFGVHRPVVRTAFTTLEHEGILRRELNRSAYVPRLSSDDINDVFRMRLLIEMEAVRSLIEQGTKPIEAERYLRMMEVLDDDDAWEEILGLDFAFHLALVDAAGSPRLTRFYRSISAETRLALTHLRTERLSPAQLASEHRELLDGILTQHLDTALDACRTHVEESAAFINHEISLKAENKA